MLSEETEKDLERAKKAMKSAERNLKEDDILTAANRNFVACENAVYVLIKSKFGSSSISRIKILTRLKEISQEAKDITQFKKILNEQVFVKNAKVQITKHLNTFLCSSTTYGL